MTGFQGETPGEQQWRRCLPLDQVDAEVKSGRKKHHPRSFGAKVRQRAEKSGHPATGRKGIKFSRKAIVPHMAGLPTPVSHMTTAVAIPTVAFIAVMVRR